MGLESRVGNLNIGLVGQQGHRISRNHRTRMIRSKQIGYQWGDRPLDKHSGRVWECQGARINSTRRAGHAPKSRTASGGKTRESWPFTALDTEGRITPPRSRDRVRRGYSAFLPVCFPSCLFSHSLSSLLCPLCSTFKSSNQFQFISTNSLLKLQVSSRLWVQSTSKLH